MSDSAVAYSGAYAGPLRECHTPRAMLCTGVERFAWGFQAICFQCAVNRIPFPWHQCGYIEYSCHGDSYHKVRCGARCGALSLKTTLSKIYHIVACSNGVRAGGVHGVRTCVRTGSYHSPTRKLACACANSGERNANIVNSTYSQQ